MGHTVQINAPLLPGDHFLQLVPAAHLRDSTIQELAAGRYVDELGLEGVAQDMGPDVGPHMPGAITVELEPGDIVYYFSQFWHRGWNPHGADRWTLHCAWGDNRAPLPPGPAYEGQREALSAPGHVDSMPPAARTLLQRFLDAPTSKASSINEWILTESPWPPFPKPKVVLEWDEAAWDAATAPWRNRL